MGILVYRLLHFHYHEGWRFVSSYCFWAAISILSLGFWIRVLGLIAGFGDRHLGPAVLLMMTFTD